MAAISVRIHLVGYRGRETFDEHTELTPFKLYIRHFNP